MEREKEVVLKYCLQNAVFYNGKANSKAVLGKVLSERPEFKKRVLEIKRLVEETVKEINKWGLEKQKKELEKISPEMLEKKKIEERKELPELPNAEKYKKIVMRLAPFPSGPLHIGNARMVILNDEYVKKYKGELILVIDDTIGSEKKIPIKEAYDLIKEGLDWLGVKYHKIIYKSDRLNLFYKWAEKLINTGHAYVCECPQEILRKNRRDGIECECRKRKPKENLEKWKKMLKGD